MKDKISRIKRIFKSLKITEQLELFFYFTKLCVNMKIALIFIFTKLDGVKTAHHKLSESLPCIDVIVLTFVIPIIPIMWKNVPFFRNKPSVLFFCIQFYFSEKKQKCSQVNKLLNDNECICFFVNINTIIHHAIKIWSIHRLLPQIYSKMACLFEQGLVKQLTEVT